MRLTAEFFVAVLVRRVFDLGGFASIERRGAQAAGAIFIRQRLRGGLENLYGPAPQASFDDDRPGDRLFERRLYQVQAGDIDPLIAKEVRFDPDLWLVEIEIEETGDLFQIIAQ